MKKFNYSRFKELKKKAINYLVDSDIDFFDYVYTYLFRNGYRRTATLLNYLLVKMNSLTALIRFYERKKLNNSLVELIMKSNKRIVFRKSSIWVLIEALKNEIDIPYDIGLNLILKLEASCDKSKFVNEFKRLRLFLNIDKDELSLEFNRGYGQLSIKEPQSNFYEQFPAHNYVFKSPDCVPEETSSFSEYALPPLGYYELNNAFLLGNEIIFDHRHYYNFDDAAIPRRVRPAGKVDVLVPIRHSQDKIGVCFDYSSVIEIEEAISFAGRCAANYFHWLIEYLPRLILTKRLPAYTKVLIPKGLWPQQIETLNKLDKFEYIVVEDEKLYSIKKLYVPTFHTKIYDDLDVPFDHSGMMSPTLLRAMVEDILINIKVDECSKRKKIFLSRQGSYARTLINISEFETYFSERGFEIVYPEIMSFEEQVKLFHFADIVVGPGGASFTNIIFCRPGTHVFFLLAEQNKSFSLFSNLAISFELKYFNLPCTSLRKSGTKMELYTSDFYGKPSEIYQRIMTKIS